MSGHSKWAQIKRQKNVTDIKRGAAFTKLANAITLAVKQGGGIGDLVEKARSINMPKENIERAIKRAQGKEAGEFEEVVYEGFGPGGVGFIVEAVTDNKMRTGPEIKNMFDKNGGRVAGIGSVSYQFQQKGLITVKKGVLSFDDLLLFAADAGAEDIEEAGEEVLIYTKPEELSKIRERIAEKAAIIDAELTRKPTTTVRIEDSEAFKKVSVLIEKLEALDEVQKVYANYDIPDSLINQ